MAASVAHGRQSQPSINSVVHVSARTQPRTKSFKAETAMKLAMSTYKAVMLVVFIVYNKMHTILVDSWRLQNLVSCIPK